MNYTRLYLFPQNINIQKGHLREVNSHHFLCAYIFRLAMCLRVIVTGILNFGHLVNADFYLRANQNSLRRHGVVIEITILTCSTSPQRAYVIVSNMTAQ